jgi:NAD+ kinase
MPMKTKVIIYGKDKEKVFDLVKKYGFEIVEKDPDFVISYGGDGTVMLSESAYPGIPKIILRNSHICKLCSSLENEEVLQRIKSGKYKVENYWKLVCEAKSKKLLAINDIAVHNLDPRHAIRYKFTINGKQAEHEIIGDGVVVATPFGSTGYYRSITDSFFEVGIGLAFNNSTEQADHMVLKENSKIKLEITRGPAAIFADNQEEKIMLDVGDSVTLEKSKEIAKIVKVK